MFNWKTWAAAVALIGASATAVAAAPLPKLNGGDVAASHVVDVRSRGVFARGGTVGVVRGGGRHFGHHHHHRRHYGRSLLWVAPPVAYYSYRRYDDCGWLRRKAHETGSRYWWRRYEECRD